MRLKRLDLTRYGKFTEHTIDFGERRAPDLHLIFGPNEAGKSTVLSAYLDLIFGIEPRSRYGYLHPYGTMRIGAALEYEARVHELVRVKRSQNDLLDCFGQPLGQGVVASQLGGLDRESYRSMFSLDDDTLEHGGEIILASKGELGQLLFSASTGLADLSRALVDLRAETDAFYRKSARGTELQALKAELVRLKEQRENIDTFAPAYAQFAATRDRAFGQYNDALAQRAVVQSRMEAIQRDISALPRLFEFRDAQRQLESLPCLPDAPVGWSSLVPKLRDDDASFAAEAGELEAQIKRQEQEISCIPIDEPAMALAERLTRLDKLKARYIVAEDIADCQREVRETNLVICGLLTRIGRPNESDPRGLVFSAATAATLRRLIETWVRISDAIEVAKAEQSMATDALAAAKDALAEAGTGAAPPETALALLRETVAVVRDGGLMVARRNALRDQTEGRQRLSEALSGLAPWHGDVEALVSLAVPEPGDLAQWKTELDTACKAREKAEEDIIRIDSERIRLTAERDAITGLGIADDKQAETIRAKRDAAWDKHRGDLTADSALVFEAAMRLDDITGSARLRHATRLAKLQQSIQSLAVADAQAENARSILRTRSAQVRNVLAKIDAAIASVLPGDLTISQVEAWVRKRERVMEILAEQRQLDRDVRDLEAELERGYERLVHALAAVGQVAEPSAGLDTLLARAQLMLDREAGLAARRVAIQERARELAQRERNVAAARERASAWQIEWRVACEECWLREVSPLPVPEAVQEILAAVAQLTPELERRATLVDRIDGLQADQQAFTVEAMALAQALDIHIDDRDPIGIVGAVAAHVRAAESAIRLRDRLTNGLEQSRERLEALRTRQRIHNARKLQVTGYFGVATLEQVAACLVNYERKAGLRKQAEDARRELLDLLRVPSIEQVVQRLDNVDRAALERELVELQARFQDLDQRSRQLFSEFSRAADRVEGVGGDDSAARIEERRRTILLQIEEGTLRYVRLRAGIVAAEHALRAYRHNHQSSMLAAASEAFRMISRGAYSRLTTQSDKDTETLIAIGADGTTKIASGLSKGTRFQLYLALRVAGYREYARSRSPVPFIADDILETFDDSRAEETLRVFANMANIGQVIYLTHHEHLCEMAKRVCSTVRVHDLSRVPASA